jgi:spermidine/putrescine transport system substrate-binding protein
MILEEKTLTRREFLKLAASASISLTLASCLGPPSQPTPTPTPQPEEKLSDTLNVYNWSDYIAPDTISNFEKEFGVKVIYDTYASNEELLAKIKAGALGYDVIFPSDYMVKTMINLDLLAPLNMKNIPNFEYISEKFKNPPYDIGLPAKRYAIPYLWGTTGIGYNSARVREEIAGWQDSLWNPNYKGLMTMLDDMRETIGAALKLLGYSVNTTNDAELEQAKQKLLEQKPLLKTYTSTEHKRYLVTGEVWIAHIYSGDLKIAQQDNPDLLYVIPIEGGTVWADNMCIPKNAPHKYTAEVFINYLLRPIVIAEIANTVYQACPNEAAKPYINPELLNDESVYPPEEVLQKLEFIEDVGAATEKYDRIWTEVKVA